MPGSVSHLVAGWAALYSGSAVLRTMVSFVHVAGLVSGGGAAIVADRATLRATRPGMVVTPDQIDGILGAHRIVVAGLAAVIASGVLLFAADVQTYAVSKLFWIKMAMVVVLMINGAILVGAGQRAKSSGRTPRTLRWTAAVSLAFWFLTTLAGAGLPNI